MAPARSERGRAARLQRSRASPHHHGTSPPRASRAVTSRWGEARPSREWVLAATTFRKLSLTRLMTPPAAGRNVLPRCCHPSLATARASPHHQNVAPGVSARIGGCTATFSPGRLWTATIPGIVPPRGKRSTTLLWAPTARWRPCGQSKAASALRSAAALHDIAVARIVTRIWTAATSEARRRFGPRRRQPGRRDGWRRRPAKMGFAASDLATKFILTA